jgi:hypothetical protein
LQYSLEKQLRKVDHCQGGVVSEELVPKELFKEIRLEFGTDSCLSEQWYYQYLKVDYYFEDEGAVVCKFKVPILSEETYLNYWINTFPVKKGEVMLRVHHDVKAALGTSQGTLFYENADCVGRNPVVCPPGLIFDQEQENCVHAMIIGNDLGKEACSVHVSTFDQSHTLLAVGRNMFAVYVRDITYSYRCPGQKGIQGKLSEGMYILVLDPSCIFDTQEWYLEGLTYHEKLSSLNYSRIKFPSFPKLTLNWSRPALEYMEAKGHNTHHFSSVGVLPTLAEEPIYEKAARHPIAFYLKWTLIGTCVLSFIALLISYLCCGNRLTPLCRKIRNRRVARQLIRFCRSNPLVDPANPDAENPKSEMEIPDVTPVTAPDAPHSFVHCSTGVQTG